MEKIISFYDHDRNVVSNYNLVSYLLIIGFIIINAIIFINAIPNASLFMFFILMISFITFSLLQFIILYKLTSVMYNKYINADEFIDDDIFRYNNYYATKSWSLEKNNNFVMLNPTQKYEHQYLLYVNDYFLEISKEQYDILIAESQASEKPLLILTEKEYNKLFAKEKVDFLEVGTL